MASQTDQLELSSVLAELQDLKQKVEELKQDQSTLSDNQFIQLRLINSLRKEPQPLQRDRGEILRALLAANGGKMLARDARKKMHLDRASFSRLLTTMKDYIEAKPYHLNKSWKVLVLK